MVAARAASADPVEDAAQVHLDRGVAAFERGEYVAAHAEIEAANKLVPTKANPYRWLALTEVQLGDCARARGNIEAFLERAADGDPRRAEMLRLRDLCSRTGTLAIRTAPVAAQLRIDNALVGGAPYRSGSFAVGSHTVIAEAAGFQALQRTFTVTAGGAVDLELVLQRPRTPITRRWWFVPALVGVVVVGVGAVAFALRDDPASLLPGVSCDATGCAGGP